MTLYDSDLEYIESKAFSFYDELKILGKCDPLVYKISNTEQSSLKRIWANAVAPDLQQKNERKELILINRLKWSNYNTKNPYILNHHLYRSNSTMPWSQGLRYFIEAQIDGDNYSCKANEEESKIPFIDIWLPIKSYAKNLLITKVYSENSSNLFSELVFDILVNGLVSRLAVENSRFLWQLFQDEQTTADFLLSQLTANNPAICKNRYSQFIISSRKAGMKKLIESYPMFGRSIGITFQYWLNNAVTLLERLHKDHGAICETFKIAKNYIINNIELGAGDSHDKHQQVAIISYGNIHEQIKVVYKPKSLEIDQAYSRFLIALNQNSDLPQLFTLKVISKDGYGYVEFIEHEVCKNDSEFKRFYSNAGRLAAILYILGCTDCHSGNLICSKNQLILIDTETLLEPKLQQSFFIEEENAPAGYSNLHKRIDDSVLRSGLTPQIIPIFDQWVDISALGAEQISQQEMEVNGWINCNTDAMLPGKVTVEAPLLKALPIEMGSESKLGKYKEELSKGFEDQCHAICRIKDFILYTDCTLDAFSGLIRRFVLRATQTYALTINEMQRKNSYENSFNQAMAIEKLAKAYLLSSEDKPYNWDVLAEEIQQIQDYDVPIFNHCIDSCTLSLPCSGKQITSYFAQSGLDIAKLRLQNLGIEEIKFQSKLLTGSIVARNPRENSNISELSHVKNLSNNIKFNNDNLSTACLLIDNILSNGIEDQYGHMEFLGAEMIPRSSFWSFGPVGDNLFSGSMGLAVALSTIIQSEIELTSETTYHYTQVIKSILRPLINICEHSKSNEFIDRYWRDDSIGLTGCGGSILGIQLLKMNKYLDYHDSLCMIEDKLLLGLEGNARILKNKCIDLCGGVAGLIGILISHGQDSSIDIAKQYGELIIQNQLESGAWEDHNEISMTGISHGTSGYIAALASLYKLSNEEKYADSINKALDYERTIFDNEMGNWPDMRPGSVITDVLQWCHGGPGIALGRTCLWGTDLWDNKIKKEIEQALRCTIRGLNEQTYLTRHHICCGKLGLTAIIKCILSTTVDLDINLRNELNIVFDDGVEESLLMCSGGIVRLQSILYSGDHFLCTPGFFTGYSGMAVALLQQNQTVATDTMRRILSAGNL
jgi:type 2 lantibiotic biosynthesis protein LanM